MTSFALEPKGRLLVHVFLREAPTPMLRRQLLKALKCKPLVSSAYWAPRTSSYRSNVGLPAVSFFALPHQFNFGAKVLFGQAASTVPKCNRLNVVQGEPLLKLSIVLSACRAPCALPLPGSAHILGCSLPLMTPFALPDKKGVIVDVHGRKTFASAKRGETLNFLQFKPLIAGAHRTP